MTLFRNRATSLARRLSALFVGSVGGALLTMAHATPARADPPVFIDWASLLPGLTDAFVPTSANDCVEGRPSCIHAVIKEMRRRFEPQGRSCHHDAVFGLAYLRTTQTYQWAAEQPGFFSDVAWMH